jgi:hypothetical protein
LMASVRGNSIFILESELWHFAVTSAGGASIFKICCWIWGRGSWGCKALCSRHCWERHSDFKTHTETLHMDSLYSLVRDSPSLVWKDYVTHTLSKRQQSRLA